MVVRGFLQLDIVIPESRSLKEKRRTVKSLKETVRKRFNVSISETGELDKWARSQISITKVSNESSHVKKEFQKIQKDIEKRYPVQILDSHEELW